MLNELVADSMVLYEHYRKDDFLLQDPSDRDLHALLDRYSGEQRQLIELTVDRVRTLGGIATVPRQVVELTVISRPPKGAEEAPDVLSRLIEVHERVIGRIRDAIAAIATSGDDRTRDLLKGMLRSHERQLWSLAELLVDTTALSA
ncbi:MAG: ferritin-like domain-containing protein [Acidimicrobiales bacterium]